MEEHTHDHRHDKYEVTFIQGPQPTTCTECGQTLVPITIYLHPEEKSTLDWLIQDRKKQPGTIIRHLIKLEGSKRRIAASKRVRPKKA
jgi:hypothetical protein